MVKTNCGFCSKEIEIKLSRFKKYKHHFCNTECQNKWQETIRGKNHKNWNRIKTSCAFCETEIYKVSCRVKKYKLQFCNMNCMTEWKKQNQFGDKNPRWNSKSISCDCCGKKNFIKKSQINKNRHYFCDTLCFFKWKKENAPTGKDNPNWRSVEKKCDFCEKRIYITPYRLKITKLHFCNKACFDEWERINKPRGKESATWKGGRFPYYGLYWYAQKKKVLKRANTVSEISGTNGGLLDIHHIIPIKNFIKKYIDLCYTSIPIITIDSLKILPYELFIPNVIFEEANQKDNLICITRKEHPEFEGMPPTFFEEIKRLNAEGKLC